MLERMGGLLKRALEPATGVVSSLGVGALGLLVLMMIYSIVTRKAFDAPLKGDIEMSKFGMVLITFFFIAGQHFKADQMVMDTFVEKLPPQIKAVNNSLIYFLDSVILGVLSWQLFAQAFTVQDMGQVSTTLGIPVYIFVFAGAVCTVLLTLVFLMHFLLSLGKFRRV